MFGSSRCRAAAIFLLVLSTSVAQATDLPSGFEETVLYDNFFADAAHIDFAPDGTLFIGAKFGHVWTWADDTLTQLVILPVSSAQHQGIMGLELDPDFANNQQVWIYYTTPTTPRNRLSRFTYTGTTLDNEVVVLDGPFVDNADHDGGGPVFAADGTVWLAMGDDQQESVTSQNPFDLRGSLLHFNQDGTPAADNPFLDGVAADPLVWSTGLRQPFRIRIQPGSGNVFIGDVGSGFWEELNLAVRGANFGWAEVEGPSPPGMAGMTYPVYAYDNLGSGAIIGGVFAGPGDFTPEYEGDYFFAEFPRSQIRRMIMDDSGFPATVEVFATNAFLPTDFEFGPDGALYWLSWLSPKSLRKITYVDDGNTQPVALASAVPNDGLAPLSVTLDGTQSYDDDDDALTFSWDFGDSSSGSGSVTNHSYAAGEHYATLTVDDGNGGQDVSPPIRIVAGNRRPIATLISPLNGASYIAGQTVSFDGSGNDPDEGAAPCMQVGWMVLFKQGGYRRPVLGPIQGSCTGSFEVPLRGETDVVQSYEIVLSVNDTGVPVGLPGVLTGTASVEIVPDTSVMSFRTAPRTDLEFSFDGQVLAAPQDVTGLVNQLRTLEALNEQLMPDGHTYGWLSWSDGLGIEHEIHTPAVDTTYTANFGCDVLVEVQDLRLAKGAGGLLQLTWSPVADSCLSADPDRYRVYSAGTPVPSSAPGSFPVDPPFTVVGTTVTNLLDHAPGSGDEYFLIQAKGSDLAEGPVGHYGN